MHMGSSTTCGISGCSEGSPAYYRQLVVTFLTMLKQGKLFFSSFLPFDFVIGIVEYWSVSRQVIISLTGNKLQCKGVVIYYSSVIGPFT